MVPDIKDIYVGLELPPVSKYMTQAKFNAYEACGKRPYRGIHEDEEFAKSEGLGQTIASGMMSVMYLHEPMTRFFGDGWAHGGKLRLSFIRPVVPGDTLTVRAVVKELVPEAKAVRVGLEAWLENQRQEKVSVGSASALVAPLEVLQQFRCGYAEWLKAIPALPQEEPTRRLNWDDIEVGEEFGPYEYTPEQADLEEYRAAAEDPNALFTTIGRKHHAELYDLRYIHGGAVNAGHEMTNVNPPIMGKRLKVYGRFVEKYIRREKPYVRMEEYTIDEDGREIECGVHRGMLRPVAAGKKWWGGAQ